ncbi:MAG: type II secretion system F family protein, partial [Eggerthella lenta]
GSRLVRYATALSQRIALGATEALSRRLRLSRARAWFCARAKRAGLEQAVSPEGFCEASMRLACAGGLAGALVGSVLSTELAVLGAVAGVAGGAAAMPRAVKRAQRERADGLESDLSEMLEVVALGLRSGLSFDRGFALYGSHFDSDLARACVGAQHAWSLGLTNREDALRDLAASYDSPLFARVVENMVRSLRFGSSLAEGLESAAAEARAVHRAQVEERVAKAPVKMMVPTGTLILPAMLLLVLGPVLLELMEGM